MKGRHGKKQFFITVQFTHYAVPVEVRRDIREMRPRDLIDIQSFIWVLGSNEY